MKRLRAWAWRHRFVLIGLALLEIGGSLLIEPVFWVGYGLIAWRAVLWICRSRFGRWALRD